ncbi:hypothetical protein Pmar_PMAR012690 [Perkinsus marinus ATCC 50983]|uniref:Uncharacterized protein n=1 Tax=Perkinsus marinus (strain ATCC 50983 / TXsc) TaxID=423536 RepID=C5K817_PERM5|nr:hypothetical protein Pmar_PMAR012690 [Perkinsus marinus ATCC 50983]EER19702.1 hypothetical protein Pmar_PMAR012690 [Perkinsus marinus ATCC 50983]|eukprot:XP_002787906.1 hypothetical protein Pmar_PMAR012690 [Perkinsus marinus ATCC 50983]
MSSSDGGFDFDAVLRADNPSSGGEAGDTNTAGMFGGGIADLESQVRRHQTPRCCKVP